MAAANDPRAGSAASTAAASPSATIDSPVRGQRLPRPARRAQLLEAAQAAFVESGYYAAAMDDIAERAGVSKPVLYQHFPSKLKLYVALLDSSCATLIGNCQAALESTQDNKQRVARAMDAFFDYVANDTGAFRLVFESDLTSDPTVREHVDRVTYECARMIAENGYSGNAERIARVLRVTVEGVWLDMMTISTPYNRDEALATVMTSCTAFFPRHFTEAGLIRR